MGAAFLIPAAMSAVGTISQAINQRNANARANAATVAGIQDQAGYRGQAMDLVNKQIQNIQGSNPSAIAAKEQGDFVSNLRRNQAGSAVPGATSQAIPDTSFGAPASALPPAAGASSRYKTGAANAQAETQKFGTDIAGEMAKIDAPVQQRMKENQDAMTLGSNLNTIAANSYTKNFIDVLRAKQAGQLNPWASMFSTAMQGGASSLAMNPRMFASTPPPTYTSQYSGTGSGGNVTQG